MDPLIAAEEISARPTGQTPVVLCASMGPNPPTRGIPGSVNLPCTRAALGHRSDKGDPLTFSCSSGVTATAHEGPRSEWGRL